MAYQPIEDYGLIGNLHTAALVGQDGSIDWYCHPHFDSPSVFAAVLDDKLGGRFKISPMVEDVTYKQFYWPDTNVLVTRFLSPDGAGEITDFMPIVRKGSPGHRQIVRYVKAIRGSMAFEVECRPAFNYARERHELEVTEKEAIFRTPNLSLRLMSELPVKENGTGGVATQMILHEGQAAAFVFGEVDPGVGGGGAISAVEALELSRQTVGYWHRWLSQCTYQGRWREAVHRSALVLKLMTFEPTGAIVASPTCSLPEELGGGRNWDYRYTWVRDAAFTLYGLMRVGFTRRRRDSCAGWRRAVRRSGLARASRSCTGSMGVGS